MRSDNKKAAVKTEVKAEVKEEVKAAVKEEPAAEAKKAEVKETKTAKKPGRKPAAKKAETEKKTPGRKPVVKTSIVFQANDLEYEPEAIMKKVMKAASKQTDRLKKLEAYVNMTENAVYYVVNGEAKDEYRIQL